MRVEIRIREECDQPRVIIETREMTEEVNAIVRFLEAPRRIAGFRDGVVEALEPDEIIRVYAMEGKVLAVTERGEYALRQRLYEVEERLDASRFVRISNSEIINLRKARSFDLSLTGTVCVRMVNGDVTYASRRYVGKIKKMLGI